MIDTLESAWLDLVVDDGFKQWSEQNNRPIRPKNAQETEDTTQDAVETLQEYADVFEEAKQE